MKNRFKQDGLGLVELMVSITLGLFLISGAIGVFFSSKSAYDINNELTWIQDNARFANLLFKRDLRMAGYIGCNTGRGMVSTLNKAPSGTGWYIDFEAGIYGWDGEETQYPSPEFPIPYNSKVTNDFPSSDTVIVRRGGDQDVVVTGHNPDSATIHIDGAHPFDDGDVLIITDCENTAVFQVTGNSKNTIVHNTGKGTPGNCTKLLGTIGCSKAKANKKTFSGDDGAFVVKVKSRAYYISAGANGTPVLYRRDMYANKGSIDLKDEEVVHGVENMQVLYGLDTNGDSYPERYIDADQVADWEQVVSVRMHLLFRSQVEVATEPQRFRFFGNTYTPDDRYLRQELISSIDLRNRG